MTISSIILLVVISGIGFCEFLNKPHEGTWFKIGSLFPITGLFAPFFWAGQPWLVVPISVFAFLLIPLAYISFFALMNQKTLSEPTCRPESPGSHGTSVWEARS